MAGMVQIAAYLALSSLALSWVALFNRAPLVFPDTISYANAALKGEVPGLFSVFYSYFILPLHQGVTFWPVVFVQGAILAHLLYLTARTVLGGRIGMADMLLIVLALAVFSSLPWLTGQVMPDALTPVVALGLYLLAFSNGELSCGELVYVGALTAFAISSHLSHVPIAAGLIVILVVLRLFYGRAKPSFGRVALRLALPLILALAGMLTVNWLDSQELRLARNSNVFLLAKWIDEGPALAYLKETCPGTGYALCAYLHDLEAATSDHLKWSGNSPFYRAGGFDALEREAGQIVRGTLVSHPIEIMRQAVIDFGEQLTRFQTGDGLTQNFTKLVAEHLTPVYGAELPRLLLESRQGRGELPIDAFRLLHSVALALSAGFLVYLLLFARSYVPPELQCFAIFVFAAVVVNAAATGALSGPYDRYLARVVWLIVFAALMGLVQLLRTQSARGSL